jgi:hypothetical protein
MARRRFPLRFEPLESRLAPAALVAAGGHSATYTDVDGDKVTIAVSTGTLAAGLFTTLAVTPGHEQLQKIDLSGGGFDNANITFSIAKVAGGDGLANVGYINSTAHDLGKVTVKGDLGRIDAGDGDPVAPAVKSLTVNSLGRYGTDTQAGGASLVSNLNGALGKLVVKSDVTVASIEVNDGTDGTIGSVTIGGSLIGGTINFSGEIHSSGDMGPVKIGHDIQGGTGFVAGLILSSGKLAGVTVGGSLIGGSNTKTGQIFSTSDMGPVRIVHDIQGGTGTDAGLIQSDGKLAGVTVGGSLIGGSAINNGKIVSSSVMGAVKIGHDVVGSTGNASGLIQSGGRLAAVTIGGSLIGGSGPGSGLISSTGDLGLVKIGHDLKGRSISGTSGNLDGSGSIQSGGRIASVVIGGSVISGIDTSTAGTLTKNASIRAGNDIGSLIVKGSVIGNTNADGDTPVIISARGQAVPGVTTDVAIGKVTIGGRVENARILAGYNVFLAPKNADAQIGAVTVGGDWVASSIAAGVVDGGNGFGNVNDALISGAGTTDTAGITSKIGSLTIKGQTLGTPNSVSGSDHYGFVAQQIGSIKVGGTTIALAAGASNDNHVVGETTDLNIHEV